MKKLLLIIALICLTTGCSTKQLSIEDYLDINNSKLDINNTNITKDLKILEEDIKDKDIILLGEWHGISDTDKIRLKLVTYLKKEVDLEYIILETSPSFAYFANQYLETGDEQILENSLSRYKGTYLYLQEEYNFIKEVYKLNKSLNREKEIRFIGIDLQHNKYDTDSYLLEMLDKENKTEAVDNFLNTYNFQSNYFNNNEKNAAQELLSEINNDEQAYYNHYKDELHRLKIVLQNIIIESTSYSEETREQAMYENFISQYIPNKKYFGKLGAAHVYKDIYAYQYEKNSFASLLDIEENPAKNNVLSIVCSYYASEQIEKPFSVEYPYRKRSISNANKKLLEPYLSDRESSSYLFKLNKENSPLKYELIWHTEDEAPRLTDKSTADYLDYIILINKSEASKSID